MESESMQHNKASEAEDSNKHVFISYAYSVREHGLAHWLEEALGNHGIRTFTYDQIEPGEDWDIAIEQAINQSSLVVILVGKNSVNNPSVNREAKYAAAMGVPVVILKVDELRDVKFPPIFYLFPVIDVGNDYAVALQSLLGHMTQAREEQPIVIDTPKSKGYVFLSYAAEDINYVIQLRQFMRSKGYAYWDYQDSSRNYEWLFQGELEDKINGARATLSVLSPAWKASNWAVKEFLFSLEISKPVFLLMFQAMPPTLVIAGHTYIDFTHDVEAGFNSLDRELQLKGLI
jgi:hypothetical protein